MKEIIFLLLLIIGCGPIAEKVTTPNDCGYYSTLQTYSWGEPQQDYFYDSALNYHCAAFSWYTELRDSRNCPVCTPVIILAKAYTSSTCNDPSIYISNSSPWYMDSVGVLNNQRSYKISLTPTTNQL